MLAPALSATLLVVKAAHPSSAKTRAPASTMASTVARERACLGSLRSPGDLLAMRVDMEAPPNGIWKGYSHSEAAGRAAR